MVAAVPAVSSTPTEVEPLIDTELPTDVEPLPPEPELDSSIGVIVGPHAMTPDASANTTPRLRQTDTDSHRLPVHRSSQPPDTLSVMRWSWVVALVVAVACSGDDPVAGELDEQDPKSDDEDRERYLVDSQFRREVVSRDLSSVQNDYGNAVLLYYSIPGEAWELRPIRRQASAPLTVAGAEQIAETKTIAFDPAAATMLPEVLSDSEQERIELGRRAFHEYPAVVDSRVEILARKGLLDEVGFIAIDGVYNGIRVVQADGEPRLALTCSMCHSSTLADGTLSAVMASRTFDVGKLELAALLDSDGELPAWEENEDTLRSLELGPGRSDTQPDGVFNPYAFPDLGGLGDMPYLHHTSNWRHSSTVTLAVRVETTFASDVLLGGGRVPRELAWATAEYLRSLPPPPPAEPGDGPEVQRGAEVFTEQGCDGCHPPPLYTSDRLVTVEEIGTDPAAGLDSSRATGHYRIPSLRGVGRTAPYLHHGAVVSLDALFDPAREEPGHAFGLSLSEDDRSALIRFLRSI